MNFFKKLYCRIYQFSMRLVLPFLPYREPKLLDGYDALAEELKRLNKRSVFLVTDKNLRGLGLTKALEETLLENNFKLKVYDETVPNPTTDNVESAAKIYEKEGCDCLIAFGGGSCMDCAKAVGVKIVRPNKSLSSLAGVLKVRKKLPTLVAIPTTAGTGSETTLAAVITDSKTRHKFAINDFPLIPSYAILDPKIIAGLPKHITSTTGMDALTHAVEAFIGRSTISSTRNEAKEAVKLIFENLEKSYANGGDLDARANMLKASYLAGLAFTKSYVGYVHAIAHSLGGKYDIPHGLANAIILPYVLKRYGRKINKKLWKLGVYANLFDKKTTKEQGGKLFIEKIEQMNKNMQIGTKIPQIKREDIAPLAKTAEKEANPLYPVPVILSAQQLEQIYFQLM